VQSYSKIDKDWERKFIENGEKRIWREKRKENRGGGGGVCDFCF